MESKKKLEIYAYHEFPEDFYGQTAEVEISVFIRPEQNFKSFDRLIQVIQNDVCIGKMLCQKLYQK